MSSKNLILATVLTLALFVAVPATQVLGVEPSPPSGSERTIGPKMWAVGIVDCITNTAKIRVKKIEDCKVDTQAVSEASLTTPISACPESEGHILYQRFNASQVFGLPCQAIITNVKNLKKDGDLVTFDAQIQFLTTDPALTECGAAP
ncbi:MAG: hypothetical protein GY850_03015 [bacterium]|nr:hypothetical protein [bacterium]